MKTYQLQPVNHGAESSPFLLTAPRGTDIVGKPALGVSPYQFGSAVTKISIPASKFQKARVTVDVPDNHLEWDQAGLLFVRPHADLPNPDADHGGDADTAPQFVKLCLESYGGSLSLAAGSVPRGSAVDWSLWPLPAQSKLAKKVTLEFVKYGTMLALFSIHEEDGTPTNSLLRVVPWCFENIREDEPDIWIGIFASRPDLKNETQSALNAKFSAFEVEDIDGTTSLI